LAVTNVPSRRSFIQSLGAGLGAVGLMGMLAEQSRAASSLALPARRVGPHFAPRAKHNIVLFLPGGPSHMDMFDPKPALAKYAGQRRTS